MNGEPWCHTVETDFSPQEMVKKEMGKNTKVWLSESHSSHS